MKKFASAFIIATVALLAACQSDDVKEQSVEEEVPQPIEVQLEGPAKADAGKETKWTTTVTQGEEAVTDADEVMYEVWEKGKKNDSAMIDANNMEDGTYTMEETFDEDGIYYVQVHVTARDMHVMPKEEIVIGEGKEYAEEEETLLTVHVDTESATVGEKTPVVIHVTKDTIPFDDAMVHMMLGEEEFEVTSNGRGEYEAVIPFEEEGFEQVTIHVMDGDTMVEEHATIKVSKK